MTSTIVPTIESTIHGLAVSSENVAQSAGIQHKNVLEMLEKHNAKFEKFGQIAFETRAGYNNAQVRLALLNEPQAMLMITFLRNTEQVVAFKVALIQAFQTMKRIIENHGTQETLFSDDFHGLRIGKPVSNLPLIPLIGNGKPYNPKTARNSKIAQVARDAKGQWVPIFIDGFGPKQLEELKKGIRYGKRTSFPRGEFNAAIRNDTLFIRHSKNEITA